MADTEACLDVLQDSDFDCTPGIELFQASAAVNDA